MCELKFSLIFLLLCTQAWGKWSVSTFNIRNFDRDQTAGQTNLVELEKIIKSVQSDVMAFEEVVNIPAFENLIKKVLPQYLVEISSCGGMGSQHLALVYNPKVFSFKSKSEDLSFTGTENACGNLRPLFLVTLNQLATHQDYIFGVVHLKAGGDQNAMSRRWYQYAKLGAMTRKLKNKNFVILGDFNSTGYNIRNDDYVQFETFISSASMKTMSENIGCTNYWTGSLGNGLHESSVIDHIVIPDHLTKTVERAVVGSHCAQMACRPATPQDLGVSYAAVSDHCPVQVTFR